MSGRDCWSDGPHFSPSHAGEGGVVSGSCPQTFDVLFRVDFFCSVELPLGPGFQLRKGMKDRCLFGGSSSEDCHRSLGDAQTKVIDIWLEGNEIWGLQKWLEAKLLHNLHVRPAQVTPHTNNPSKNSPRICQWGLKLPDGRARAVCLTKCCGHTLP